MAWEPPKGVSLEDAFYDVMTKITHRDWLRFARSALRLEPDDIDDIQSDYRGNSKEQKFRMLETWSKRIGSDVSVEYLYAVLNHYLFPSDCPSPAPPKKLVTTSKPQKKTQLGDAFSERKAFARPTGDSTPSFDLEEELEQYCSVVGEAHPVQVAEGGERQQLQPQANNDHMQPINNPASSVSPLSTPGSDAPETNWSESNKPLSLESKLTGVKIQSPPLIAVQDGKKGESFKQKLKKAVGLKKEPTQPNSFNPPSLPYKNYCEKVDKVEVKKTSVEDYHEIRKKDFYPIKKPKGCVLILNNTFKSDEMKTRHGSGKDVDNMEKLWLQLGCEIYKGRPQCDKTKLEMKKLLGEMTQQGQYSFIVIVIMTHGGKENGHLIFEGEDNASIRVDEIEEMFNNENAKKLHNIPKLFIFQFCRGKSLDKGVACDSFDDDVKTGMKSICSAAETTLISNVQTDGGGSSLPRVSDMLFAYATQLDFVALRHPENGSWFINAITNVFMNYANVEDVDEMLTRVNRSMKEMSGTYEQKDHLIEAMSSTRKNFCKKLYLLPGI